MIAALPSIAAGPGAAYLRTSSGSIDASGLLARLVPGDEVLARVEVRLPDGSFRTAVAGQEFRMTLPASVSAGDVLQLTFITLDPLPSFSLKTTPSSPTDEPILSGAGRLASALMSSPNRSAPLAVAATTAPLSSGFPGDARILSAALQNMLEKSGLFYEAHQADWIHGKFDSARLRAEPQASLVQSADSPEATKEKQSISPTPETALRAEASASRSDALVAPQGLSMVQQQLAVLESGRLLMRFYVAPEQEIHWEVEEHLQDTQGVPAPWCTRLSLDLPALGKFNASLTFAGNDVQIAMDAPVASSATLLQSNLDSLQANLRSAGIGSTFISVARHDQK